MTFTERLKFAKLGFIEGIKGTKIIKQKIKTNIKNKYIKNIFIFLNFSNYFTFSALFFLSVFIADKKLLIHISNFLESRNKTYEEEEKSIDKINN